MYEYKVLEARAIDGDTVELVVDLGFDIRKKDRFRLYGPDPDGKMGLNAPEINTPEGKAAKQFVTEWLATAAGYITVRTIKDRKGKYGRYLGILYVLKDSFLSLNQMLLDNGHAKLQRY